MSDDMPRWMMDFARAVGCGYPSWTQEVAESESFTDWILKKLREHYNAERDKCKFEFAAEPLRPEDIKVTPDPDMQFKVIRIWPMSGTPGPVPFYKAYALTPEAALVQARGAYADGCQHCGKPWDHENHRESSEPTPNAVEIAALCVGASQGDIVREITLLVKDSKRWYHSYQREKDAYITLFGRLRIAEAERDALQTQLDMQTSETNQCCARIADLKERLAKTEKKANDARISEWAADQWQAEIDKLEKKIVDLKKQLRDVLTLSLLTWGDDTCFTIFNYDVRKFLKEI